MYFIKEIRLFLRFGLNFLRCSVILIFHRDLGPVEKWAFWEEMTWWAASQVVTLVGTLVGTLENWLIYYL